MARLVIKWHVWSKSQKFPFFHEFFILLILLLKLKKDEWKFKQHWPMGIRPMDSCPMEILPMEILSMEILAIEILPRLAKHDIIQHCGLFLLNYFRTSCRGGCFFLFCSICY